MKFSIMTYNLDYNTALQKSLKMIDEASPDFLCLQEFMTSDENIAVLEDLGYTLIDYSNSRIRWNKVFGVATFYRNSKIEPVKSKGINLPFGIFETFDFFLRGGRLQRTILTSKCTIEDKPITITNIHLSPYSTNSLRDKQLHQTFADMNLNSSEPVIILGDFNYPYNRSKFEKIFGQYNLTEATTNILNTFASKIKFLPFVRFKLDYVLYKNLKHVKTKRLNSRNSDHVPIISTFSI